jgi:hypothetical protein
MLTISSSYSGGPGFVDGPETAVVPEMCPDFPYSLKTTARVVNWRRPGQLCSMFFGIHCYSRSSEIPSNNGNYLSFPFILL